MRPREPRPRPRTRGRQVPRIVPTDLTAENSARIRVTTHHSCFTNTTPNQTPKLPKIGRSCINLFCIFWPNETTNSGKAAERTGRTIRQNYGAFNGPVFPPDWGCPWLPPSFFMLHPASLLVDQRSPSFKGMNRKCVCFIPFLQNGSDVLGMFSAR